MFWGLIVEPSSRYYQDVDKAFHVSQAALDTLTGDNEPCQVMVIVDGKNYLICTLQKNKCIQVPLDLYFKSGTSVAFMTNGKCNIHLTGYLDPDYDEEEDEEDEEEDEEEEVPQLVPAKNKRKLENGLNANEGVKKSKISKKKAKGEPEESSDDEDQFQKLLSEEDLDSDDENDESFQDELDESDEEAEDDEDAEDEGEDEEEAMEQDSSANNTLDTSKDTSEQKLSKSQKKRLKKKLAQEKTEAAKKAPQANGVPKKAKTEAKVVESSEEKKEKKNVNGVSIEDLKVGSGPAAKVGKVVQVYYEGRLKTNNKMFDSCTKGPGFKFRLGSKEVIKGWDNGVVGMKVGGKRKIVCPPPMAYGAKGSPPVIPPNATLIFEVELKSVK